jgi:hypothetical protein
MKGIGDLYHLAEVEVGKPAPMMLFPLGDWSATDYPELTLAQSYADEVMANFEADVLRTKVPVESDGTHKGVSPAAGWIDRLYMAPFEWKGVSGDALFADWTPNQLGAQIVNDGQFAYDSVDICPHKDPVTGSVTPNVLKATALTNRPVLRMMPGVKEAGDSIKLSEPITLQLSEVSLAEPVEDPIAALCDKVDALLGEMSTQLKGKAGIPAIRTMLREVKAKAAAHTLAESGSTNDQREALQDALADAYGSLVDNLYVEDFGPNWVILSTWDAGESVYYRLPYSQDPTTGITLGQPVEVSRDTNYVPVSDSSPAGAPPAVSTVRSAMLKATEGQKERLAEGDAAPKGCDHMDTKTLKALQLTEGASEEAVQNAVMKLAERTEAAETALAERDKADHAKEFTAKLAEAMKPDDRGGVHMLPGEKDSYLKLAELDHDSAIAAIQARIDGSATMVVGEKGTGDHGKDESKRVDVEFAERSKARAAADKIAYPKAMALELSENPDLKTRYDDFLTGKEA